MGYSANTSLFLKYSISSCVWNLYSVNNGHFKPCELQNKQNQLMFPEVWRTPGFRKALWTHNLILCSQNPRGGLWVGPRWSLGNQGLKKFCDLFAQGLVACGSGGRRWTLWSGSRYNALHKQVVLSTFSFWCHQPGCLQVNLIIPQIP
jgi:hypothetical protein